MLGFVAQNPRNGTVGSCYTNTDVSGRKKREEKENRKLTRGHRATQHGRATCVFGAVRSVAARVCVVVQFLLAARFRL